MLEYRWAAALLVIAFASCANEAGMRPVSVSPAIAGETNAIDVEDQREDLASVAVDMPGMQMPSRRYPLRARGNGRYEASNVDFPMAGVWHISTVDAQGHRHSSFTVSVR